MLINTIHKTFPKDECIKICEELNNSDDGWNYIPNHDPKGTGNSFIEIYDEDGEFISRF